jgi:hypothetical protein
LLSRTIFRALFIRYKQTLDRRATPYRVSKTEEHVKPLKMSQSRKQAAEKLVASLKGKQIEVKHAFHEVQVRSQSYHSPGGEERTIVLYVRFEETENKYKGFENEKYSNVYFDNIWMSNTHLKTKDVPAKLRKFLEQERYGGNIVFCAGMKFNEKQPESNTVDREHWPWVWGRDINVVFTLDSNKHKPEKVSRLGLREK